VEICFPDIKEARRHARKIGLTQYLLGQKPAVLARSGHLLPNFLALWLLLLGQRMHHILCSQRVRKLMVGVLLCVAASSASAGEINVTRTNLVDRWITNLIEIRMPANHFVNDYHTNWITQMRTNIVDIYATNLVTRTLTNRILVDTFQTNLVAGYYTNSQTINLTNWQAVVVIKTNLTVQPVTTTVEVAMKAAAPAAAEPHVATGNPAANPSVGEASAPPTVSLTIDGLVIEASRVARPNSSGQIEVTLKAHNAGEGGAPVQIHQWRVERDDGTILVFGQDQDFRRELPVGRYKLELKTQREGDPSLATTRAILAVTAHEALLQQRLTAKR
jgi:hypothetical protein